MTNPAAHAHAARPPLILTEEDHTSIQGLAAVVVRRDPLVARLLQEEADRADVVPRDLLPVGTVAVGSFVEFHDTASNLTRQVQIVLPGEANFGEGRISVLSLVGAGLLGLSRGQSIDWPMQGGRLRRLTIVNVPSAAC